jgi:hypothetical protein
MRFAYADPPYLGMCKRYEHHHPDGLCWDDVSTHAALIGRLGEYDGWALSCNAKDLRWLLPLAPDDVLPLAWVKTWASWKPGVYPARAWEPVLMKPASIKRKWKHGDAQTPRDWLACPVDQRGFFGAKPDAFTRWLLACLGVQPDDQFDDLFPGSGAVTRAYEQWVQQQPLGLTA